MKSVSEFLLFAHFNYHVCLLEYFFVAFPGPYELALLGIKAVRITGVVDVFFDKQVACLRLLALWVYLTQVG